MDSDYSEPEKPKKTKRNKAHTKVDNLKKRHRPDGYGTSASNSQHVKMNDLQQQLASQAAQSQKNTELLERLLAQGGVANTGRVSLIWPTVDSHLGKYSCFCSSAPDPRTGRSDGPAECRPAVEERPGHREVLHLQDDGPGGEGGDGKGRGLVRPIGFHLANNCFPFGQQFRTCGVLMRSLCAGTEASVTCFLAWRVAFTRRSRRWTGTFEKRRRKKRRRTSNMWRIGSHRAFRRRLASRDRSHR